MSKQRWGEKGIIDENRFVSRIYNAPAKAMVVHFSRKIDYYGSVYTLYSKNIEENVYKPLLPRSDKFNYISYITSQIEPFIYVNVWNLFGFSEVTNSNNRKAPYIYDSWKAIERIDLNTFEKKTILEINTEGNEKISDRRYWVSDITGIDTKLKNLYATVVVEKKSIVGSWETQHWLSCIDIHNGKVELLSEYKDKYF